METKQIIVVFNKQDEYGRNSRWYDEYKLEGDVFIFTWRGRESRVNKTEIQCIYNLTTTARGDWYPNDHIYICPNP